MGIQFVSYSIVSPGDCSYDERIAWSEPLSYIDIDEFPILHPHGSESVWMIPGSIEQMTADMDLDDARDAFDDEAAAIEYLRDQFPHAVATIERLTANLIPYLPR